MRSAAQPIGSWPITAPIVSTVSSVTEAVAPSPMSSA